MFRKYKFRYQKAIFAFCLSKPTDTIFYWAPLFSLLLYGVPVLSYSWSLYIKVDFFVIGTWYKSLRKLLCPTGPLFRSVGIGSTLIFLSSDSSESSDLLFLYECHEPRIIYYIFFSSNPSEVNFVFWTCLRTFSGCIKIFMIVSLIVTLTISSSQS